MRARLLNVQCSLVRITVNKFNKHNDLFGTIVVEVCINCLYIHSHDKCIKRCDAFKKRNSLFRWLFSYLSSSVFHLFSLLNQYLIMSFFISLNETRRKNSSNLWWYLNLNTNFLWNEWSVWFVPKWRIQWFYCLNNGIVHWLNNFSIQYFFCRNSINFFFFLRPIRSIEMSRHFIYRKILQ